MRMVGVGGLLVAAWLAGVSNILGYDSRYDNSASSPRRPPGPLRDVAWGEGTSDEMCVVYLASPSATTGFIGAEPRHVTAYRA